MRLLAFVEFATMKTKALKQCLWRLFFAFFISSESILMFRSLCNYLLLPKLLTQEIFGLDAEMDSGMLWHIICYGSIYMLTDLQITEMYDSPDLAGDFHGLLLGEAVFNQLVEKMMTSVACYRNMLLDLLMQKRVANSSPLAQVSGVERMCAAMALAPGNEGGGCHSARVLADVNLASPVGVKPPVSDSGFHGLEVGSHGCGLDASVADDSAPGGLEFPQPPNVVVAEYVLADAVLGSKEVDVGGSNGSLEVSDGAHHVLDTSSCSLDHIDGSLAGVPSINVIDTSRGAHYPSLSADLASEQESCNQVIVVDTSESGRESVPAMSNVDPDAGDVGSASVPRAFLSSCHLGPPARRLLSALGFLLNAIMNSGLVYLRALSGAEACWLCRFVWCRQLQLDKGTCM
ncbi:hypothetical protein Nepgr_007894 [Nepenthes gracilis]|uniref:Uncharacterized protein n=1 Tax=Nepenthes gracilis TaxID=150966 RepID=A0AAD3S834_NEPGR|nr:hypothetical protein Nepgr_007894 [Nepenthes gracilis]